MSDPLIEFVVTRPHQDKDGNLRSTGEMLALTEADAAPFRARRQLMTLEEYEAWQAAQRERAKKATYEFHHYERP